MNKKILFLLLCLIAMLSVSAVSAIDDVTDENVSDEVVIEDTSYVVADNSASNENTKGNFTELQEKIKNTPSGGICDLDKDYEFIDGESTINIHKPIIIDGHNHTIDGKFNPNRVWGSVTSFQFNITSNDVVIKNINLLRCNSYDFYNNLEIKWIGDNGCLDNVSMGGTNINLTGNNFNISNSSINEYCYIWIFGFNNIIYNLNFNYCPYIEGNNVLILNSNGDIGIWGKNNSILNSTGQLSIFGNNASILNSTGRCYIFGDNGTLKNIKFSNNVNLTSSFFVLEGNNGKIINLTIDSNNANPISSCSSIYLNGNNISLLNSTISKNNITNGYFIYSNGENCKIINCSFVDNIGSINNNNIYICGNNFEMVNSIFENNSHNDALIYLKGYNAVISKNTFINHPKHETLIKDNSGNSTILNSHFISSGLVYLSENNKIINSTFINNYDGIHLKNNSVIGNSTFINNSNGIFLGDNSVIGNSTFINNSYFYGIISSYQTTIDNSIFLNNKLNDSHYYHIRFSTDNDKTLNILWDCGNSYFINAIRGNHIILNNVTYWGSSGIMNSGQNETIEKCGGIPIIVEFYNSKMELVKNITATTDSDGKISIDYINLIHGKYFVKAYHLDDSYYGYYEKNTTVTSNLYVPDVVKYYKSEDRLIATLYDDDGNVISDAKVEFKINGQTYTRITDKNGIASMGLNLESGVYNVWTKYNNTWVHSTVTIKSTIEANDLVKMYKNATKFSAKFTDSTGKALANSDVRFNINGVFYTRITDSNGVASLGINLRPGDYILTAYNPVNGEEKGVTITVKSLIVQNDLTKYYLNASRFQATIYNKDGSLAVNKEVIFNINGVFYHKTTDSNGVVSLAINLRPGNYIITTIFDGLDIGNKVTVLPTLVTKDLNMKYLDGSDFTAQTLNGQGIPLANQKVSFNVNGVFYHRISNGDGMVSLKIRLMSGEYIITSYWNDFQTGNIITIS